MSDTLNMLTRSVERLRDRLALPFVEQVPEYERPDEWDEWDEDGYERHDFAASRFYDDVLDAYAVVHVRPSSFDVQSVVLIMGTGGPHIEAEIKGDRVEVRGYWGGDTVVRYGTASDDVSGWAETFADEWTEDLR